MEFEFEFEFEFESEFFCFTWFEFFNVHSSACVLLVVEWEHMLAPGKLWLRSCCWSLNFVMRWFPWGICQAAVRTSLIYSSCVEPWLYSFFIAFNKTQRWLEFACCLSLYWISPYSISCWRIFPQSFLCVCWSICNFRIFISSPPHSCEHEYLYLWAGWGLFLASKQILAVAWWINLPTCRLVGQKVYHEK